MGFTIIGDLQNNFDLSYLLMSNVSIERMRTFLMLTGFTVLLQQLTTFYSFLSNVIIVQELQQKTVLDFRNIRN